MSTFKDLGIKANTDKINVHHYERFYPFYLEHLRNDTFNMLEIGVQYYYSINLWLNYFPKAKIYGIDINTEKEGERFSVKKLDQSNEIQIENYSSNHKNFFKFIIDDGSHIPEHQLLTFNHFFNKCLEPGGIYIIEDIETSYWSKNNIWPYDTPYGYNHHRSLIEIFKHLIDYLNKRYLTDENLNIVEDKTKMICKETKEAIATIQFCQNCIIIKKKNLEDYLTYNEKYYWYENL